ncbi:sensor domain-containing diguanylate cyclase [Vibrio sp. 05-20-BW147]|uniref:sensor domain-containing diguanylate cyclase n=1 Tax=Vibrio sp. 05-20-BW147 TaxID=2575834 RepID=UPI001594BEF6|nr:sensor domain-containing diguanylate cyclase [Vibrio sp. 05-20-BW147]NVC64938.1 sensor domain-containing diguanylate cyclase [Vibrio sp. 05-20-BW147]
MPKKLAQTAASLLQLEHVVISQYDIFQLLCQHLKALLPVEGVQICQPTTLTLCALHEGVFLTETDLADQHDGPWWQWLSTIRRDSGFVPIPPALLDNQRGALVCRLSYEEENSTVLILLLEDEQYFQAHSEQWHMLGTVLQQFWLTQCIKLAAAEKRRDVDNQYGLVLNKLKTQTRRHQAMSNVALGVAELTSTRNEFDLLKQSVILLREELGLDRVGGFLIDHKAGRYHGVFGTDDQGQYRDESQDYYPYIQLDPRFLSFLSKPDNWFYLVSDITLYHRDQPVGHGWNAMVVLRNESQEPLGWFAIDNLLTQTPFDFDIQEALEVFAKTVSRILVEIHHNSRVRKISQALQLMSQARNTLEICQQAVEFAVSKLDIDRIGIFVTSDSDPGMLQGTYGVDTDGVIRDESYFSMPYPDSPLFTQASAKPNTLVILDDVPLWHDLKMVGYGWNAAIALSVDEQLIAFICADNLLRQRLLTSHQRELIQLFTRNFGEMLARLRGQEKLEKLNKTLEERISERTKELQSVNHKLSQMARTDSLTQLYNRRAYEEFIQEYWHTYQALQKITLAVMDLDGFKLVNDQLGHQVGDELLRLFADLLRDVFNEPTDRVTRLGGDEFALIMCGLDQQAQLRRLSHLIEAFDQQTAQRFNHVSVSIGAACVVPTPDLSTDGFFSLADQALYQAKANGKHQLVVYCEQ